MYKKLLISAGGGIVSREQQADKGPYYGGAILHSVKAKDLQNRIDGCIERNSRNSSNTHADMSLREQSMAQTLRNLRNSSIINRKFVEESIYRLMCQLF